MKSRTMVGSMVPEQNIGEKEYNKQRGHCQFLSENQAKLS
jgi:hypothetical protein